MTSIMPILSNYQEGTRNAKVYLTQNGHFGVITYDSVDDYNGFESFPTEDEADIFAESWVLGHESV